MYNKKRTLHVLSLMALMSILLLVVSNPTTVGTIIPSNSDLTEITTGGVQAYDSTIAHVVPPNVTASIGETFPINVVVENVMNLYGLDIQFSWDTTILEYVSHTAKIPVETYPDGILHQPGITIMDTADPTAGTYALAYACMDPAPVFDGTGVAFEMTFHVVASGECLLEITHCDLADVNGQPIVHTVQNGYFTTGGAVAPIASFDYYPLNPVVSETVTFDASASYDPDGYIIEYMWDFGDGTSVDETQPITYHSYSSADSYNVELTVIDNDGESGFALTSISIGGFMTSVHVVPQNVVANLDETFNIAVEIVDVHDLYGLDIQFSWDPTILEYITHTAKIPVEGFPDGILHEPAIRIKDEVNATAGTYWLCYASIDPAPVFDGTGVAFEMTFHVIASGACMLEITRHELADVGAQPIVHTVQNGYFTSVSISMTYVRTYIPHEWIGDGSAMNWHADDDCWSYPMPFSFPFFEANYDTIYVSSNGLITFTYDSSCSNSIEGLAGKVAIAPAWDDWVTDGSYDIYIWQNSSCIGIRWNVRHYGSYELAEFEALLFNNGVIQFNYGYNSGSISTTIGISNGYDEILAEDVTDLNRINSIVFTPILLEHELLVYLEAPDCAQPSESAILNATVMNIGFSDEINVELYLLIDGSIVDAIVANLTANSCYTLHYLWTPQLERSYNVTAYAPPVPDESFTANNIATKMVNVITPMIHPEEGQYANYLMTVYNESGQMLGWMKWNITYANYVTPYLINVTTSQQDISGHIYTSSILVNVLTREMSDPYSPPDYYYFGWIETNITIGSTIRLLDTTGVVKGEEIVEAAGTHMDCWIVEMAVSSGPYVYNYTMWYDKATGLWIGMKWTSSITPDQYAILLLVDTNIPVGGAFQIETGKPMYTRFEVVTATATLIIGDTPVESATVTIQVNYPNGTVYFVWTTTTNTDGTATIAFFIDENAPYGIYAVSATAYKPGIDPRTATTTFIVGHLEPHIEMWFEGPDVALIGFNTTIILHIQNVGNATAYNVGAAVSIPNSLVVISANTTFTGIMDPGHEVTLVALVMAATPSRHTFNASTSYTKVDGTPMDTVYAEKTLVYAYHEDYAVDLVEMTVTATSEQIILSLAITNYGDSPVEITLIASAQHISSKLMLPSVYQTITINPGETATISLVIAMPSTAPSGDYIIQGILATGLPSQDGFTLTRGEETVTV